MPQGPAQPGRRSRTARGVSFIEVIAATVVLALTVATMATTVGAIRAQQDRSAELLACAELANRLVIQYIDDRNALPSQDLPIGYGASEYRWRLNVSKVESHLDAAVERNLENYQNRQAGSTPDSRLTKVIITVWLSEKSGGTMLSNQGAPQSSLVRIVDPLGLALRSPDTLRNQFENNLDDVLKRITGQDDQVGQEEQE
jgi:hypothetical protein